MGTCNLDFLHSKISQDNRDVASAIFKGSQNGFKVNSPIKQHESTLDFTYIIHH